ncbi:CDP-diacylglycerol--inositol 3-phosphatidyltransferase-like [Xenia sp. Carnegie-2017]|uniref:CDP-diacylglycerol--inositol 3-phosphatidyltransferase-like n=1 Tax=Xenia sp. Carnegie-2017 TaxID=2897299 RepID=UPI001F042B08|nr:CDP-diacylglycerol--inositol 3-phosphatidyltransferase-like [Xenia sp. Carnegie-2017]
MAENVFLFVPNLIGYARIIFAFVSFHYMADRPILFFVLYLISSLLDAFDGHFARLLGQASKFGAMLDMLTDRCASACLILMLSNFYPTYRVVFQFLISLDISSHWLHMYSSLIKGDQTHKTSSNFFLKLYYTSRPVLFIMCAGNELFLLFLYLLHFSNGPNVFEINATPIGLWSLLAYINFPIFFVKQLISLLHLVTAAQDIVAYDVAERRKSSS